MNDRVPICNFRLLLGLIDFDGIKEGAIYEIRRASAPAKSLASLSGDSSPLPLCSENNMSECE